MTGAPGPSAHRDAEPVELQATTVGGILRDAAASAPDVVALVEGDGPPAARRRWTYAQLWAEVSAAAGVLGGRFERGERVAVWAATGPETLILSYAGAVAGLVVVPCNPAFTGGELEHVLRQSGAAGVFVDGGSAVTARHGVVDGIRRRLPAVRDVETFDRWEGLRSTAVGDAAPPPGPPPSGPSPDDVAQLVFTSGTTGSPKGAMLTHRGMTNAARLGAERFGIRRGDVYVDLMPLHHVGGQVVAFQICQQAATAVLPTRFDAGKVLELLETERATLTCGVPTMLLALIDHPDFARRDLSSLRAVSSGGAVVPSALIEHVEASLGVQTTVVFGQTEACGFISQTFLDDSAEDKASTLGTPLPGIEARVVRGGDGGAKAEVTVGEVGELEIRGFNVMAGYHDQPADTARTIDAAGWLATGDLVTMDARGYLRMVGRTKDMVVSGGENIYPAEIERALAGHEDVAEAVVVGIPDDRWGEALVAAVRPSPGHRCDPAELESWLRGRLAGFKVPRRWLVVDRLPLTASGKVRKFVLRRQILDDPTTLIRTSASSWPGGDGP